MASSGYSTARWLFGICNVLFLFMGVAMLVVGAYLQIAKSSYVDLIPDDNFFIATALMISSGVIVIVVCLFGFAGLWMESQCILAIYFLCVLIVLAMEITAGALGFVFYGTIDSELRGKLLDGIKDTDKRKNWDEIQQKERCCGVGNYTDWYGLADPEFQEAVPDSCCDGPICGIQGASVAYNEGCYQKAKDWIEDNFWRLGLAGIILGVCQVILLVSVLALIINMRMATKV